MRTRAQSIIVLITFQVVISLTITIAAEDPEASDRKDRGAKYAQSLDDRDHESKGAKEKKEGLNRAFNKGLFNRALKEALRSRNEN